MSRSLIRSAVAAGAWTQRTQIALPQLPSLSAQILRVGLFQSSSWTCSALAACSIVASSPRAGLCATRTTQQSVPPFLKKPYTESEVYESWL
jgi:hypothetical protein